jgi:hypothetical protein
MQHAPLGIWTALLLLLACSSDPDASVSALPTPSGAMDSVAEPEQPAVSEQPTDAQSVTTFVSR